MLTQNYVGALLVDEDLANQVFEVWDKGEISDRVAWLGWWLITINAKQTDQSSTTLKS